MVDQEGRLRPKKGSERAQKDFGNFEERFAELAARLRQTVPSKVSDADWSKYRALYKFACSNFARMAISGDRNGTRAGWRDDVLSSIKKTQNVIEQYDSSLRADVVLYGSPQLELDVDEGERPFVQRVLADLELMRTAVEIAAKHGPSKDPNIKPEWYFFGDAKAWARAAGLSNDVLVRLLTESINSIPVSFNPWPNRRTTQKATAGDVRAHARSKAKLKGQRPDNLRPASKVSREKMTAGVDEREDVLAPEIVEKYLRRYPQYLEKYFGQSVKKST